MMNRKISIHLLVLALAGAGGSGRAEEAPAARRAVMGKWLETRRLISVERQDWRLARETLTERADALRRDLEAWREKTGQIEKDIAATDAELAQMTARRDELRGGLEGVVAAVARLEQDLRALLVRAPAPLRERVSPLSRRLPEDPADTRLGLAERAGNAVGILNEMDKFAREIAVTSEVRELADGVSAEVTALYLGFGQAYYCNEKRGLAGVGRPGPDGWAWAPRDDLAASVAAAVAVYRNEKPAVYIPLPADAR